MKNYEIVEVTFENYNFIIISKTYEPPFTCLTEICQELLELKAKKGKVVFDMLFKMGNTSERFMEAYFNENEFEEESFIFVKLPKKHKIREISRDFYFKNKGVLEYSILNSFQMKMIAKGIAI